MSQFNEKYLFTYSKNSSNSMTNNSKVTLRQLWSNEKSFESSSIEVTNPIQEINSNIRSWLLFSETMKARGPWDNTLTLKETAN